jgi:hypothetical protein
MKFWRPLILPNDVPQFKAVSDFKQLKEVQRGSLRCISIKLRGGDICLYSPVRGLATAAASLVPPGRIRFLLAPNHYHNAGLTEHLRLYPRALLCASDAAALRLRFVTGLRPQGLDACAKALGPETSILQPAGLKTGEVWLKVRDNGNAHVAWVVTDAFCGPRKSSDSVADTPEILGTFPSFGIDDRTKYVTWVRQQLARDQPTTLIPCHGALIRDANLPEKLERLLLTLEKFTKRSSVRRTKS